MLALFLSVFFAMAGFAALLPTVLYAVTNLGISASAATLVLSAYSFAAFLAGPGLGRLSDGWGRRPVLIITYGVAAAAYLGLAIGAGSVAVVVLAMAVAGAMSGNLSVVYAAVADRTDSAKRSKGMGMVGAAVGFAFVFGPGVGGYLGGDDPDQATLAMPAYAAALFLLLSFLSSLLLLSRDPETRSTAEDVPARRDRLEALKTVARYPLALPLCIMVGLYTLALSLMEPSLPLLLEARFEWGPKQVGRVFLLVGLILVLVQGGVVGRLAPRLGEALTSRIGMGIMAVGLVCLALGGTSYMVTLGAALAAIGSALTSATLAALTSRQARANDRGLVMGAFQSFQAMARTLGPLFAGLLFETLPALPFLAGSLLLVCVIAWSVLLLRRRPAFEDR